MIREILILLAALSFVLNCITGCAYQQSKPSAHAAIANAAFAATSSSIQHAQAQAAKVARSVSDPVIHQRIVDLQSSLNDAAATNLTTGQQLTWFEADDAKAWKAWNDSQETIKARDATIVTLKADLHQTAKERDFYPVLIAFLLGWTMLRALTPTLSAGLKVVPYFGPILCMLAPEIAFAIGAALGFIGARTLAAYCSHLMP